MTATRTRITSDVDFDKDGKHNGWLRLPYSSNRSAHGNVCIPVTVVRNGSGPTILFAAGNHGDEYEGQIALVKLARALEPRSIRGRVIILPASNFPAAMAGLRNSPIDSGNLNRSFPGDPDGTPTEMIAHYIGAVLLPMADLFMDIHSGGNTLVFTPYAMARLSKGNRRKRECVAALRAFDAPLSQIQGDVAENRFASSIAETLGIIALAGEFGGGGQVSVPALQIVERGLRNLMIHMGVIEGSGTDQPSASARQTRFIRAKERTYASDRGLFEPFVQLGDRVIRDQPAGAIHFIDNPMRPPVTELFTGAGMVMCVRAPGQCERGDALFWLGEDCDVSEFER